MRNILSQVRIISLSKSNSFRKLVDVFEPTKRRCKISIRRKKKKERKKERKKKVSEFVKTITTRMECSPGRIEGGGIVFNQLRFQRFLDLVAAFGVCFHSNFPLLKSDLVRS